MNIVCTDLDAVQSLIDKLDNPIDEIKCRALVAISSKLQRDLLTLDERTSVVLAEKSIQWLNKSPLLNPLDVLKILQFLVSKEPVKQTFIRGGGLAILAKLRNQMSTDNIRALVDDILGLISGGEIFMSDSCQPVTLQQPPQWAQPSGYFNFSGSSLLSSTSASSNTHNQSWKWPLRSRETNAFASNSNSNERTDRNELSCSQPSTSVSYLSNNHVFTFPLLALTKTDRDMLHASVNSIKSGDHEVALAAVKFFQDVVLEDFAAEIFLQRPAIVEVLLRLLCCNEISLSIVAADALICLSEKLINRIYFHLDPNNYCTMFDSSQSSLFAHPSTDGVPNQMSSSQDNHIPTTTSSAPNAPVVHDSAHMLTNISSAAPELPFWPDDIGKQSYRFSVPGFCIEALRAISCGLRVVIDKYLPIQLQNTAQNDNCNNEKSPTTESKQNPEARLLQLMWLTIRLLLVSISPVEQAKANSKSVNQSVLRNTSWNWMFETVPLEKDVVSPHELPRGFLSCLEPWGQLLSLLASTWNDDQLHAVSSVGWSSTELTKQIASVSFLHNTSRHVYLAILGNMYFLISSLFTPETALAILPVDLRYQLSLSLLDVGLLFEPEGNLNELQVYGLPMYVALFNCGIYNAWQLLTLMKRSMTQLVNFLSRVDSWEQNSEAQEVSEETLNLAVEGLDSVDIVGSNRFASDFVRFLSELSMSDRSTPCTVLWRGQLVLLRLLSHPIVSVRKAAYNQLREVIQHATDPRVVSDPCQRTNALEFLLRDEVLCELLEFGLKDDCVEISASAEQLLWCLLDSYEYLPQSSWRTLHRLCMESAPSNATGTRCRPLNIILGIYSTAEFNSAEPNTFGGLALDWCLGHMTPNGRRAVSPGRIQSSTEQVETTEDVSAIHSACRLLFHPCRSVRSAAALVVARHLRSVFAFRSSSTAGTSSSSTDTRMVTGMSAVAEVSDNCGANVCQTSTPVEPCILAGQIVPALIDCLLYPHDEAEAIQQPPYILDHIDRLGCESTDTEQVNGIVRATHLFVDDQADLNVRRAAGEHVLILGKRPGAALTWLSNEGLSCLIHWFSHFLRDSLYGSAQGMCQRSSKTSTSLDSVGRVLFPVFVRLLHFVAVWSAAGRKQMAFNAGLLLNLLYLRLAYCGSDGLHADLVCLIALLLFDPVVREAEECPICLPTVVAAGYLLPFTCPTYSLRSQWREVNCSQATLHNPFQPLLDLLALSNSDEHTRILQSMIRRAFRLSWSFACNGGLCGFMKSTLSILSVIPSGSIDVDPGLVDVGFRRCNEYTPFLGQLSMSNSDVLLVLLAQWDVSVLLCLTAAQRATNHGTLVKAISMLHRCCAMCLPIPSSTLTSDLMHSFTQPWWSYGHFDRFLSTLPACSADFQLLISLLQTIERTGLLSTAPFSLSFGTTLELCQWLLQTLVNDRGPLSYCLLQPSAGVGETDSRRLISAKRRLVYYHLPRFLYQLTERLSSLGRSSPEFRRYWSRKSVRGSSGMDESAVDRFQCSIPDQFFRICLHWSLNAVAMFISTPFSDLVRLRFVLGVLCNLTSPALWLSEFDNPWLQDLLLLSAHLLTQFDLGREEANASFMGLGSLQLLLLLINQIIQRILVNPTLLDSIASADSHVTLSGNLPPDSGSISLRSPWYTAEWILRCLVYRSVEVRSLSLSLLGRISLVPLWAKGLSSYTPSAETRSMLSAYGRDLTLSGSRLWAIAFTVLFDRKEASLCRIQALQLLTNLTSLPIDPRDSGIFPPLTAESLSCNAGYEYLQQTASTDNHISSDSAQLYDQHQRHSATDIAGQDPRSSLLTRAHALVAAGDRPTVISRSDDHQSSVIDLRDLFDSDITGPGHLQSPISQLLDYLRPLFEDIQTGHAVYTQQHSAADRFRVEFPWLLHTSPIPRDTLLPCYYDSNCGLYLLGLPALQQLLMNQNVFPALHELLSSYLPQPLLYPPHWNRLIGATRCHASTTVLDSTGSVVPKPQSSFGQSISDSHLTSVQTQDLFPKALCTPLMVTAICQLVCNLLRHLPKLVLTELSRMRINSFIMNIVDPTLLEAVLTANSAANFCTGSIDVRTCINPWSTATTQFISAFSACLRVLRCQAAMHDAFRVQLASDARFLAQLIRSLKHTDFIDLLAPLWRELFTLLTCILLPSEDADANDPRFRLVLQPLSSQIDAVLMIALGLINRCESELARQRAPDRTKNTDYFCKIARSALYFITVALSCYRPLSSNPVVLKLETQTPATQDLVASFTRRLISLTSTTSLHIQSNGFTSPTKCAFMTYLTTKLPIHIASYRRALLTALRTFLGVCRFAKSVALQGNLLEQQLFNMKLLQTKLDLCCLSGQTNAPTFERPYQATSAWNTLSDELISQMEIVHNLIYVCPEARKRVVDTGFPQLTLRLWPLALQDDRILHSLLSLLTNLTADCPYASASLVNATNVIRPGPFEKMGQEQSSQSTKNRNQPDSVLHRDPSVCDSSSAPTTAYSLVQLLYRLVHPILSHGVAGGNPVTQLSSARSSLSAGKSSPTPQSGNDVSQRFVFQLLANMMWAAEARCALLRIKLLHRFTELDTRVVSKSRRGQFTLTLWLQLLINLSFTRDGQQILFGESHLPEVLISCVSHVKGHNRERALLVLRNLCTSTALKSHLLSGDTQITGCFKMVLTSMEQNEQSLNAISLVISALLALIYGNQKVRVQIRSAGYLRPLTTVWSMLQKVPESRDLATKIQKLIAQLQR